jgi:hypothetical protein
MQTAGVSVHATTLRVSSSLLSRGLLAAAVFLACLPPTVARATPPMTCAERIAFYLGRKPALLSSDSRLVAPLEGDWAPFLDQTITLGSGIDSAALSLREFSRLGPDFWEERREDWERSCREVSTLTQCELQRRGLKFSNEPYFADPLSHYDLAAKGDQSSPLHRLNRLLMEQRLPTLQFKPAGQMGIAPPSNPWSVHADGGTNAEVRSPLALNWLGLSDEFIPAYLHSQSVVREWLDFLVLQQAYFRGRIGNSQLLEAKFTGGAFHDEWSERQKRRRNRAYRIASSEAPTEEATNSPSADSLREREGQEAQEFFQAWKGLVGSAFIGEEGQEARTADWDMMNALKRFLHRTGVEAAIEEVVYPPVVSNGSPLPVAPTYRLRILTDLSKEKAFAGSGNSTPETGTREFSLNEMATTLHRQGVRLYVHCWRKEVQFDPKERSVSLPVLATFERNPPEAVLEEVDFSWMNSQSRLVAELSLRSPATIHVLDLTTHIRLLKSYLDRLTRIRALRLFLSPVAFNQLSTEYLERARTLVDTLPREPSLKSGKDTADLEVGIGETGLKGLVFEDAGKLILWNDPHSPGSEASEAAFAELLARYHRELKEHGDVFETLRGNYAVSAELPLLALSQDEAEAIVRQRKRDLQQRTQEMRAAPEETYLADLLSPNSRWRDVDLEHHEAKIKAIASAVSGSSGGLTRILPLILNYLDQPSGSVLRQEGVSNPPGVEFTMAHEFVRILDDAWRTLPPPPSGIKERFLTAVRRANVTTQQELASDVFRLAQNAKNRDTELVSYRFLARHRLGTPEVKALLLEKVNARSGVRVPEGAIQALQVLFPEDAGPLLVPFLFLDSDRDWEKRQAHDALHKLNYYHPDNFVPLLKHIGTKRDTWYAAHYLSGFEILTVGSEKAMEVRIAETALEDSTTATQLFQIASTLQPPTAGMAESAIARLQAFPSDSKAFEVLAKVQPKHSLISMYHIESLRVWLGKEQIPHDLLETVFKIDPHSEVLLQAIAENERWWGQSREKMDWRPIENTRERLNRLRNASANR